MKECEKYQKTISDAYDNQNLHKMENEITEHLKICAICSEFLASLENFTNAVNSLPDVEVIEKESLFTKIWKFKISIPLPAAAVLVLILLGYIYTQYNQHDYGSEQKQTTHQVAEFVKFEPQSAVLVESTQ